MGTQVKKAEKQSSRRRDEIVARAAALFAKEGVRTTTVRDIAEASGMLAGSLYYHFESKEEIVDEILSRSLGDLFGSYRHILEEWDDPGDRLRHLIRASFEVIQKHPAATAIYLKDRDYLLSLPRFARFKKIESDALKAWTDVIADGIKRGHFRPDVDPMLFYRFAVYPIWWTVGWMESNGRDIGELADQHIRLVMEGVQSAARPRTPPGSATRRGRAKR